MKYLFATALFICTTLASMANVESDEKITKSNIGQKTDAEVKARMEHLEHRLEEIKGMDFSTMERAEKKNLKDEVKEIKKEMAVGGYITISAGALLLIILLIILL